MCKWIMDEGASKRMSSHRTAFDTYEVITSRCVHLDDNSFVQPIGMGSIIIETILKGVICIKDVFHMSKLLVNLFLVNKLVSNGLNIQFNLNGYIVKSCDDEAIVIKPREHNLYVKFFCEDARSGGDQLGAIFSGSFGIAVLDI